MHVRALCQASNVYMCMYVNVCVGEKKFNIIANDAL